jgi:cytidylate kinase
MNADRNVINQMRAITISREYGSGGGEIARRLAERLEWRLVDHEVVVRVAHELGITVEEATARDERVESLATRILASMPLAAPIGYVEPGLALSMNSQLYREALVHVVQGAAETGHVVIVGRGSQVVLANRRDVLHVRIVAPLELRIPYVMKREGLDYNTARSRIQVKDQDRHRFLQEEYHHRPDETALYDIVLNTGAFDLDTAVEFIVLALQRKAERLSLPADQLGPGAGLTRYPGRPSDIRPPQ